MTGTKRIKHSHSTEKADAAFKTTVPLTTLEPEQFSAADCDNRISARQFALAYKSGTIKSLPHTSDIAVPINPTRNDQWPKTMYL